MNGIVVDASVTLSRCFPDEQESVSLKVLDLQSARLALIAPRKLSSMVLNRRAGAGHGAAARKVDITPDYRKSALTMESDKNLAAASPAVAA